MHTRLALAALASTLAMPAAAAAHVTLQPREVPAGGYARMNVRVPNEKDDAGTTKVVVQMPPGITSVSYEPVEGWDVEVERERVAEPIDAGHGETSDERVSQVTISGDGRKGVIAPGQFRDFGLSFRIPDGKAGDKLTFKALQTYEDGEVVRWIGPEDADKPAATVTLTASARHGTAAPAAAAGSAPAPGGDGDGLAVAALIVGALGLLTGALALVTARRRGGA